MRRIITTFLSTVFLLSLQSEAAFSASKVWSYVTAYDNYDRPDLSKSFNIERVEVGIWDDNLDLVHFWIQFKSPLTPNQFNDGLGSWAGIFVDVNNDDEIDLRIETKNASYTKNYWQSAYASKGCDAVTWMDLDRGSENVWLGFRVSQKCWGLPNKFKVQGYADYISGDDKDFDYAPDSFSLVDLDDYYKPKPKISLPIPNSTKDFSPLLKNYSSAPRNLPGLVESLRSSVVTIECTYSGNSSSGTAWSAKVALPAAYSNYSYLITNYHVVSDCVYSGKVDVILDGGTKVIGYLAAWDPDNDLAGIYVDKFVKPLVWQGVFPIQGAWAGVIGSPRGFAGVVTSGIVSSVNIQNSWMTFTAPINPGNSGGPVFDSAGRVIAVATAKMKDSEGFGIGNGVPLLCQIIIECSSSQLGWLKENEISTGLIKSRVQSNKVTIICKKGKLTRQIKEIAPVCPKGYKRT